MAVQTSVEKQESYIERRFEEVTNVIRTEVIQKPDCAYEIAEGVRIKGCPVMVNSCTRRNMAVDAEKRKMETVGR